MSSSGTAPSSLGNKVKFRTVGDSSFYGPILKSPMQYGTKSVIQSLKKCFELTYICNMHWDKLLEKHYKFSNSKKFCVK